MSGLKSIIFHFIMQSLSFLSHDFEGIYIVDQHLNYYTEKLDEQI